MDPGLIEPSTLEPQLRPWWVYIAVPCLVVVGIVCICGAIGLSVAGGIGELIADPLGWLREEEADGPSLAEVLDSGESAAFVLREPCSFYSADGSVVKSDPNLGGGSGFAQQLGRTDVVASVLEAMRQDTYLVEDGEIRLETGTQVEASQPSEGRVSLGFYEEEVTDIGTVTRSLQGVVEADRFRGKYYFYRSQSVVNQGQGYEEETTITADFTCRLEWVAAP